MAKGLQRSITRGSKNDFPVVKQRITLRDFPIVVNGATGEGSGQVDLAGQLPEGYLRLLGAASAFSCVGPGVGHTPTWSGSFGVQAGNAVSAVIGPAVGGVSPRTVATNVGLGTIVDNTDGTVLVSVFLYVADPDISADGVVFRATVDIELVYILLLDD